MKIVMIGTGYVGLVTGTCFAESGNDVICVDIDQEKIKQLRRGEIPIYEPGLSELVRRNAKAGRLRFTNDYAAAVPTAHCVFISVGTPQGDDGSADLQGIWSVVESLVPHLAKDAIVVTKSNRSSGDESPSRPKTPRVNGPRRRCRLQSGIPQGRGRYRRLYQAGPGCRRCHPTGCCRKTAGTLPAVSADRASVFDDGAGKRRDDQIRRQQSAGNQDQLHQRDGQSLRTGRC